MPRKIIDNTAISLEETCNIIRRHFCKHIFYILGFTAEIKYRDSMPHLYDIAVETIIYGIARTINRRSITTIEDIEKGVVQSSYYQLAKALDQHDSWEGFVSHIRKCIHPYGSSPRLLFSLGSGNISWHKSFEIPPPSQK